MRDNVGKPGDGAPGENIKGRAPVGTKCMTPARVEFGNRKEDKVASSAMRKRILAGHRRWTKGLGSPRSPSKDRHVIIVRGKGVTHSLDEFVLKSFFSQMTVVDCDEAQEVRKGLKMLKAGQCHWLHVVAPMGSWLPSRARSLRSLRTKTSPLGAATAVERSEVVKRDNLRLSRAMKMYRIQMRTGGWATVAAPHNSFVWHAQSLIMACGYENAVRLRVDSCMYVDGPAWREVWLSSGPLHEASFRTCADDEEHRKHHCARRGWPPSQWLTSEIGKTFSVSKTPARRNYE